MKTRVRGTIDELVQRLRMLPWIKTATDPTVRLLEPQEQRIQHPPNGLRSLVDCLPDAALLLDQQSHLLVANAAAQSVFGQMTVGEHIGRSVRQPELVNAIRSALTTEHKVVFELSLQSPTERRLDGAVSRLTGFGELLGAPALLVVL